MSDAPERISLELLQGMADDFWSECRDPRYAKSAPVAYVRADRLEAQEALLREAMEVLGKLHHAVCGETGFAHCVRLDSGLAYPWPALDDADEPALATIAKLRAHLEEPE